MKQKIEILLNGLKTGLILQLAIGPVFFYLMNLTLQKGLIDGIIGVIAVTLVDFLYITLSVFGIGKILERKRIKKVFGIISSLILIILGGLILISIFKISSVESLELVTNHLNSFVHIFLLTISNPLTIIFFTSIFTAKSIEYNYSKKELVYFGLGTGFSTFIFMFLSVLLFSLIKGTIPIIVIQVLNFIVGVLIIGYGAAGLKKSIRNNKIDF